LLAATYCKARVGHRIVAQAIVVAVGVAADGRGDVLGFVVGDSGNEGFWTSFLRSLIPAASTPVVPLFHAGFAELMSA
jgi:putative transposase